MKKFLVLVIIAVVAGLLPPVIAMAMFMTTSQVAAGSLPPALLVGYVNDTQGNIVVGATAFVTVEKEPKARVLTSDDHGQFWTTVISGQVCSVTVWHPKYGGAQAADIMAGGVVDIPLVLRCGQ